MPPSLSACNECGSVNVVYDPERKEVCCQGCGLVVDIGSAKDEARQLLDLEPVVLRKPLLRLCHLWTERKTAHERVEATYAPEIQGIQSVIGVSGRSCRLCGTAVLRQGKVGRAPQYCHSCKRARQRGWSKQYRDKSRRADPEAWKMRRRIWRLEARKRSRGDTSAVKPGTRPLTKRELKQLH
jgi:hypothetical protein